MQKNTPKLREEVASLVEYAATITVAAVAIIETPKPKTKAIAYMNSGWGKTNAAVHNAKDADDRKMIRGIY